MNKKIKAEEYSKWDKNIAKELTPLEIINIKLKDKNNKYDRRVVNCRGEYLYLIKEEELNIIKTELKEKEKQDEILRIIKENEIELLEEEVNDDIVYRLYINGQFISNLTKEEFVLLKEYFK